MNLMGSGIWGIGFAIVDARKKKLLKRLIATPMSRADYLASFLFFRLSLLVIEVATLIGFGALVFGVPLRGSFLQLVRSACCRRSRSGHSGLLVASRARTDRGRVGPHEPRHAADVGVLRRVLLVRQLSRSRAAVHPGACRSRP